jgi:transcriptional regulator with XRE-family HTH domain
MGVTARTKRDDTTHDITLGRRECAMVTTDDAEVAERVGMAQLHLSRIEQRRHDISFSTLVTILAAMGSMLQDLAP